MTVQIMMKIMQRKQNPIPQPALKQGSATWEGVLTAHGTLAGEGVVSVAVNAHTQTNAAGAHCVEEQLCLPQSAKRVVVMGQKEPHLLTRVRVRHKRFHFCVFFSVFFALRL